LRVPSAFISGTSATTIGISRTEESVTAKAAAISDAPDVIAPTSTTLAGSAQTAPTISTVSARVKPDSLARLANPTWALTRIRPGTEQAASTPRKIQRRLSTDGDDRIGLGIHRA
jgi:hypothetical protein